MKNIYIILCTLVASCAFSQVAIGKTTITNTTVSLEFGVENKGIILPWVTSAASVTGAVDGTIIYDIADKKVKYRKSGTWFDLSVDPTGAVDVSLQTPLTESATAKVVIGTDASTNTTPGILVLSDTDKAMILPKMVSPHLNIISPAAGMMVYDTLSHQLAVFNGTVWSFWRP